MEEFFVIHDLWSGLAALDSPDAILYLFAGSLIGVIMGVIPGIGGAVILSITLSFVLHIDIAGTLCLFLGVNAGSYFSASMTSILLNTPAHPEAFAVTLDGFPMARRGQAGRALGLSATATCIGGIIGCGVLLGFLQVINYLPDLFHPPEYVALIFLAMVLAGTIGAGSASKAVISMGLGLAVASVGASTVTGALRFTFGNANLFAGFSLVSLLLGLFAVPQMVLVFGTKAAVASQDMTGRTVSTGDAVPVEREFGRQAISGVAEAFRHWRYLLFGGLIGSLTGLVPGIGGFAANFMSYGAAQRVSRAGNRFGSGVPEGVIAPEASSLSKEAGSMIPIIGLGIPGSVGGALFLAALTIKGLRTGYGFADTYPVLPYEMLWIILLAGIIGTAAGLAAVPVLAQITRIPGPILVLFIYSFVVLGSYVADVSFFACIQVLIFGVVGFVLRRLRYPLASFVLGLVLGPTLEANLHLTQAIYPGGSFLIKRPFADAIFLLVIILLVAKVRQTRRVDRLAGALAVGADHEATVLSADSTEADESTYPVLELITTFVLLVSSAWFVVYGVANYDPTTELMPAIGGLLVVVPSLVRVARYVVDAVSRSRQPLATSAGAREPDLPPVVVTAPDVPNDDSVRTLVSVMTATDTGEPCMRRRVFIREGFAFLWLAALLGACYLVGFSWAVAGFALTYGLVCTREHFRSWRWCALFSILSAVALYLAAHELFASVHIVFDSRLGI